jgi:hypothetical protein
MKGLESVRVQQVIAVICRHSHTNYAFRTYAFPNVLRIRARKRVVLHNSLPTEHAYSWTMLPSAAIPTTPYVPAELSGNSEARNLFLFFSSARNHLKIRPEVIDSKRLD